MPHTEDAVVYVAAGRPRPQSVVHHRYYFTREEAQRVCDTLNTRYPDNRYPYIVFEAIIGVIAEH